MIYTRVDDFPCSQAEFLNEFNLESFKKFNDILLKHNISYYLGCVPALTTDKDLEWFATQKNIGVALHGINHPKGSNEFKDYETEKEIKERLVFWKNLWKSKLEYEITAYIPPNNIIDHKTVRALLKADFDFCWGGPETEQEVVDYARNQGLKFEISDPPWFYGRTDEMIKRNSLEHIRTELDNNCDVYLTFHFPWEQKIGLENLDKYLFELRKL